MFVLGHLGLTLLAGRAMAPFAWAGERFPLGFLLAGAALPDLIDKPLGHAILPWDNGRLWAHTLVFAAALVAVALVTASRQISALSLGAVLHQAQDQMWLDPSSWLWPFAGPFPRSVSSGAADWVTMLTTDPFVWATELAGLLAFAALLVAPLAGLLPRWWTAEHRTGFDELGEGPEATAEGGGETLSP